MAKGNAFIGVITGKLGDAVGYRISYSSNKVTQGWRPYIATVKNPKTELQAIQRLKMAPAVNFYRALGRILDNAWQGERYGNKSRQYFMSLAMSQATGIPFIVKGDKRFYPGEYAVAQGSLVRQSVTAISDNLLTTSIVSPGVTGTWGEFSQGIINKNFGIKDGDKLTFIFVGTTASGDYLPAYSFVILDTTNTAAASEILASSNMTFSGDEDSQLQVGVVNAVSDIVAGAVILSRLDTTAGARWLRSNSVMFVTPAYKELRMGANAYQAAVESYMSAESIQSDWYLNAGISGSMNYIGPGGNSGSNVYVIGIDNITFTADGTITAAVATMSDGTKRLYRSEGDTSSNAYILQLSEGQLYSMSYKAFAYRLTAAREVDSAITGWIIGQPVGTIEEP